MANIIFRKVSSTEPVEDYLIGLLTEKLIAHKKVFWLVPGGSAIKVAAAVSQSLSIENLANLTVSLTDERYGPVGHADSNWPQLEAAGFKLTGATLQPVLIDKDLEQTTRTFARTLETDLGTAEFSLALIGMGPDGHICGIKPGSEAVGSEQMAASYQGEDFIRITTTAKTIEKLDEAVVYAVGEEKWPQLDLLDKELDPNAQPAQLLKRVKRVIIFNDYKGETG